ncbi:MAG: hypothetical protein DRH26_14080 [Deltaproteobacteria bacterium]|nr:MAG: hypothetical protein DRH26_14080 [Deltaproteobacteria bacterium]
MVKKNFIIGNEQGSAIVFALLILVAVTILGISSTNTSVIEFKIVGNERIYQRDFYIADSAWKYGAYWLDVKSKAPSIINTDPSFTAEQLKIVRNFGDAAVDDLNDNFIDGTNDGAIDSIPYWYNVQYDKNQTVPGSGMNYRKFSYIVKSNANKKQGIEVRVVKIFKIGY